MFYPQEIIEEVRNRNDIIDVVSSYVTLKQKGTTYFGLCPFHNEKSPSFSVNPDKQMYYCFGCGASGNVVTFVMQMENYGFVDAIKTLAQRVNYTLPEGSLSEEAVKGAKIREELFEINKTAAKYFYNNLNSDSGKEAAKYLDDRQIAMNIRTKFGLGYSLNKWDGLYNHLLKEGFHKEILLKSGLVLPGKSGGFHDRFSGRVMFPIFDVQGRVVGFGGRVLEGSGAKYLNSPETPIFNKSQNLYGINFARRSKSREYLLVEGYMDTISLHQNGYGNAVASLGTAFNGNHAGVLRKYCDKVILIFDSDEAGKKAAVRAIPVLTKAGLQVKILSLQDAKDPDEYFKKFGKQAFESALANADDHVYFQVKCVKDKYNLEKTDEKVQFTFEVSKILSQLDTAVEIDAYTKDISNMTGIDTEAVKKEISRSSNMPLTIAATKRQNLAYIGKNQPKAIDKGVREAKKDLLCLLVSNSFLCDKIRHHLLPEEMSDPIYSKILGLIYDFRDKDATLYPAETLNYFETLEDQRQASEVFNTAFNYPEGDTERVLNDFLRTIKRHYLDIQMSNEAWLEDADMLKKLMNDKRNVEKLYITI